MYPTVMILLVQSQRSMADICVISPSNPSKFVGPAVPEARPTALEHPRSIAVRQIYDTMDDEVEPRHSRTLQSRT